MSSLPTNSKWILSIATEKKWQHRCFRRSRAAYSQVSSGIWPKFDLIQAFCACPHYLQVSDLAEFRTHPSSYVCHRYLQVWKGSDQKQPRKRGDDVFPIITLRELSVAMETRVLIRPGPKPNAGFIPIPMMLQIKFGCNRPPGLRDIHVWNC